MSFTEKNGLKISSDLFNFINNEVIPGTELKSEEFWINFKVWGILPITFIFTAFQIPLIRRYKANEE